jgi:nitrogen-specific signal transduction histidine kinase/CheY-like chemotaxis protein
LFSISELKKILSNKIKEINTLSDNTKINKIVEDLIVEITGAEYSSIWIYDFPVLRRRRDGELKEISVEEKKGLLYECFAKKQAGIYNYISSEKGYVASIDNPDNIKIKSKIMVPIVANDTFIGIATAYSSVKNIRKFTKDDLKIFQAIEPFIIESINKMKQNCDSTTTHSGEVSKDIDKNLDDLQKSIEDVKAPDEILNYVSNIVHDIRTPANGLLGFLEILEEQIDDSRLKEYINHAKNSAFMISELTTSILDSVSDKREHTQIAPKYLNTFKYFSEIAEMYSANLSQKNINYNVYIDPLLPKEIGLDSSKLKRVIMNLLSNASKFTPENGFIEFSIRYKTREKKLHIFVKDSGIGIAKENQEKIFEAFEQAQDDTKDTYGGTGLGLSICAKYVKEMGGKLMLDSQPNQGSTFYFELPLELEGYAKEFKELKNKYIDIAILMDKNNTFVANHIVRYLVKIGIDSENISFINSVEELNEKYTHLICFENKLSDEVFNYAKTNATKLLIVEERFLSLSKKDIGDAMLISQYTYFGDSLYNFINKNNIPKVLVVEDDSISTLLIRKILEDEFCEIDIVDNGKDGLELLESALKKNTPYNIVYTDHEMPYMTGTEMIKQYKKMQNEYLVSNNTISVSISGDDRKISKDDYDYFATKPFKKNEILNFFFKSINTKEE